MSDYPKGHAQNPFTQADVDAIKPNDNGVRIMPSGHYAARSRFGEGSSFGAWSSFEGGRTPDDWTRPFFAVDRIGSEHRKAYFFSFGGMIHVRAGCFFGDEPAFLGKLDADGDARKSRQYRAALELARDILGSDGETA